MTIRADQARDLRIAHAQAERAIALPEHPSNGDEALYPNHIASFSKGMKHDEKTGEVDPTAYAALTKALTTKLHADFEAIPLGGGADGRKLTNPQAGLGFSLAGADPQALGIPAAPAFDSAAVAGEIVENYWMAHARHVHFNDYDKSHATIDAAAKELSQVSVFKGPKTAPSLFRGIYAGEQQGPYLSQFLMLGVPAPKGRIPFGAQTIDQRMYPTQSRRDYMTEFPEWLAVQNGAHRDHDLPADKAVFIRNGADLAQWVHIDALYQAYFNACLILLAGKAPFDPKNPYAGSATQDGFGTFGGPHILSLVTEVATHALKAVWFQKWYVHRRLRPEAFAGRIHQKKAHGVSYPIHDDAIDSEAVARAFADHDTYLLPMAFPEGSPLHPAYGAGHATVAGACVTILKAWFKESTKITELEDVLHPVQVNHDGSALEQYTGADAAHLTVGSELNKLAGNIAIGRNFAGVHWRSDYTESLLLGEKVALRLMRDQRKTYHEAKAGFEGLSVTTFKGETVVV